MPDGILETSTAIVRLLGRPSPQVILNPLDPLDDSRRLLRNKRAAITFLTDQERGNVPELGWEILMDELDVHWSYRLLVSGLW